MAASPMAYRARASNREGSCAGRARSSDSRHRVAAGRRRAGAVETGDELRRMRRPRRQKQRRWTVSRSGRSRESSVRSLHCGVIVTATPLLVREDPIAVVIFVTQPDMERLGYESRGWAERGRGRGRDGTRLSSRADSVVGVTTAAAPRFGRQSSGASGASCSRGWSPVAAFRVTALGACDPGEDGRPTDRGSFSAMSLLAY